MRFKLDENLGRRGARQLRAAGHDVSTVFDQSLASAPDIALIEVCRIEQRALITFDKDFSDPVRFRPSRFAGIILIRLPKRWRPADLSAAIDTVVKGLNQEDLIGRLWIVEKGRVVIHQDRDG